MIWFAAGALLSAAGSIYSGRQQKKAAKKEAELKRQQGELLWKEAQRSAAKTYEDAVRFSAEQKMSYLSSGVEFEGSASDTVKQTLAWGKEESDAILERGKAERKLGLQIAANTESAGRAAMIASYLQAGGTALSAAGSMASAGARANPSAGYTPPK